MKGLSITARVTEEDLQLYMRRSLSSKELAKKYGVTVAYLTRTLPDRPREDKSAGRILKEARKEFRNRLARQVIAKEITVQEASNIAHCSTRNIWRHIAKVRNA